VRGVSFPAVQIYDREVYSSQPGWLRLRRNCLSFIIIEEVYLLLNQKARKTEKSMTISMVDCFSGFLEKEGVAK